MSAVREVLSFESVLGIEEGRMRKWCWWIERCVSGVGECSSVWHRGIYLCAACLVAQCPCMMGYFLARSAESQCNTTLCRLTKG